MPGIGLWQIDQTTPRRLNASSVGLEQDLESWIASDPSLLEQGLQIVARQFRTDAGPLDLLALDTQGRWVLIEIKRGQLRRDVIAQAIDYASCVAKLDRAALRRCCDDYLSANGSVKLDQLLDERGIALDDDQDELDLVIYLVGTGVDPGLERMVAYLSASTTMAIRLVTFSVFQDSGQGLLLAREIHEPSETDATSRSTRREDDGAAATERLLALAEHNGIADVIRPIYDAATDVGLIPMPKRRSFMIAPPQQRSRCLVYLPIDRRNRTRPGEVRVYMAAEAFEQFFGITQAQVIQELGWNDFRWVDTAGARSLAAAIRRLFAQTDDANGTPKPAVR